MHRNYSISASDEDDEAEKANGATLPHHALHTHIDNASALVADTEAGGGAAAPADDGGAVSAAGPSPTIGNISSSTAAAPTAAARTPIMTPDAHEHVPLVYVAYPRPVVPLHGISSTPLMPSTVGRHNGFLRTYKVLIVGEAGVGKSNLMHRYCYNQYDPSLPSTIGAEFCSREVDIPSGPVGQTETVVLQLWDTAGQERNAGVVSNAFYRNAVGAIVVYDVTRRETLLNVPRWVARVMELAREDCVCVVVGAKTDLLKAPHSSGATGTPPLSKAEWEALQQEADRISHALGMRNFFTSALSGDGVLEAFTHLVLAVDAVQATPAELRTTTNAAITGGSGGGGFGHGRYSSRDAHSSQMWTAASTVPASPIGLFGRSSAYTPSQSTDEVSRLMTPSPGGMTPSPSGFMSPGMMQIHASNTANSTMMGAGGGESSIAGSQRSASNTPGKMQKKTLDLRGFGPGDDRSASPANAAAMGGSSCGC